MEELSIKTLMEAGVHFGHQTKRWNPKMRKYIFGARNGINIINLQKSIGLMRKALKFAAETSANGGTILFVGTKPQSREIMQEEANRCGMPFIIERWLGGTLTNFETIKKSVARLNELNQMAEDGTFEALAKKEVIKLEKERGKLLKNLGGVKDMGRLPDAMFIVDTKKEHIALKEGLKLGIPVIAIVDTNCDPDGIEYLIPGNDDAVRSIRLIAKSLADAVLQGGEERKMRQKAADEEAMAQKAAEEKARAEKKAEAAKAAESGTSEEKAGEAAE